MVVDGVCPSHVFLDEMEAVVLWNLFERELKRRIVRKMGGRPHDSQMFLESLSPYPQVTFHDWRGSSILHCFKGFYELLKAFLEKDHAYVFLYGWRWLLLNQWAVWRPVLGCRVYKTPGNVRLWGHLH
jgi:hypothetical protein